MSTAQPSHTVRPFKVDRFRSGNKPGTFSVPGCPMGRDKYSEMYAPCTGCMRFAGFEDWENVKCKERP